MDSSDYQGFPDRSLYSPSMEPRNHGVGLRDFVVYHLLIGAQYFAPHCLPVAAYPESRHTALTEEATSVASHDLFPPLEKGG